VGVAGPDRRRSSAATLIAAGVFLGCWVLLRHWFWARHAIVDTPTYERYGNAIRGGQTPYRDFAVEYPPGALPVFVVPTFLGSGYAHAFGWLMAACGIGCAAVVAAVRASLGAVAFVAVSPLLIGSLALSRFDFWPALVVATAIAALLNDRHLLGWAALGAAFAIKLYAFVLVPLAVVWTLRRRGVITLTSAVAIGVAVAAAAFGPFVIAAPGGLWDSLWGQADRPLQIESLAASFLTTFGQPEVVSTHGSQNLAGQGWLAAASTALQLGVLVILWAGFARGPAAQDRLLRYAAGAVCAFIAFGKVLSPQFLIWLVPLVPLVRGRRGAAATAILAAALIATQVYFPKRYFAYAERFHLAWLVLGRNVLLIALLAALILPARAALRSW
jgi:Glycosyltransferase family 87